MANELRISTKTCTKCREDKPLDAFARHGKAKDGRNWACRSCKSIHAAARYQENKPRHQENNRRYYQENKTAVTARVKKWKADNPERYKERMRASVLRQYNLTVQEYDAMFDQQNGLCSICHEPETDVDRRTKEVKRLAVDHDHYTGVVRGLLCRSCNLAVGQMDDDPARLRSAADYLEAHFE
jgi:hypothetical protein